MPSGSTVFVDTNVLIYSRDPRDPIKRAAAMAWLDRCWRDGIGRISTQVLNELYATLRRLAAEDSPETAREMVRRYRAWQPWVVDAGTVDRAWLLQDRFALNYWDGLMVAAAQMDGCSMLLTEDLQHGQSMDGLRIVNPFRADPSLLDSRP